MNRLSHFLRAILAIAMMLVVGLPTSAVATPHTFSFKVDSIYYNYIDKDAKTIEVTYGEYIGVGIDKYSDNVTIPSTVSFNGTTYTVTAIDDNAFYECWDLTSITIPNSVTAIGKNAFSHCYELTSVTIPNSVTTIGDQAFRECKKLSSVTIGNSVTEIPAVAFFGCKNLTSVIIGNSVTKIGNQAFASCYCLPSINIPNSITTIGRQAFGGCFSFTSIYIPYSVTSIGNQAFQECSNLTSIIVDSSNSKFDSRNNCNAIIETATNTLISGCKNTIIPNSVITIGSHAFSYCKGLSSISIPNSVTSIGDYAFYDCSGLTSISIPNSVTSIGNQAFYNCQFPVLHLPMSVTHVGLYNTCADICYCYNSTPPTGGGYTSDRLYVPKGSLTAYATAEGWKMAKQIMEFDVDDVANPILTIAYPEGGVIKQEVDNGEILKLQIVAANGWKCHSATFNSTDVTNQIDANGYYNTPAITANSQLNIVFVKNDGRVANALIDNDIKVCVKGNIVTIFGADEFSDAEIYNTAGATIYNGIDKSITLDTNGIYILTVEGCTFKFSI